MIKPVQKFSQLLLAALLTLSLAACDSGSSNQAGGAPTDGQDGRLEPLSFAEWEQQLQDYQPQVVVLDLWAMWCTPCIKRFPKMVDMHEKYSDRGVQIVAVNLDNRDDQQALQQAEQFLDEINANFDNYRMDENLIDAFEHFGLIGIPAVIIYDRQGNERYRLTGNNPSDQFTDEDIEQAIDELLAEAA